MRWLQLGDSDVRAIELQLCKTTWVVWPFLHKKNKGWDPHTTERTKIRVSGVVRDLSKILEQGLEQGKPPGHEIRGKPFVRVRVQVSMAF